MNIQFNTPLIPKEHFEKLQAHIKKTIEKNIHEDLKKEYAELKTAIPIYMPYSTAFFTYDEKIEYFQIRVMRKCSDSGKELSQDLIDFFELCVFGTYEAYCRDQGLIK